MKKVLLLILSIAIVLSTVCLGVVADENMQEEQVLAGETVTVVFSVPEEYANVKSGALTYEFDESVFELVEGSAKWMLSSLFIKDVKTETKEAIFAFTGAKAVKGDLFTMTLKAKEDAPIGEYKVSAMVNFNQGDNNLYLVNLISVVEEQIEIDDPTTPADFAAAVENVKGGNAGEQNYAAIADAVAKYNALTSEEKKQSEGEYKQLLSQIEEYNNRVASVNEEAENTVEVAFSAISGVFAYLSRLFKAFVQMIWF